MVIDKKFSQKIRKSLENPATLYIQPSLFPSPILPPINDLHLSFAIHLDPLRCFQLVASDGACDMI